MVRERWVNVSSPYSDSRLPMEGIWGLPRLREQSRCPRGGKGGAESPEVRKILLGQERSGVSERGQGRPRPGGLESSGSEVEVSGSWARRAARHTGKALDGSWRLGFHPKSHRRARKDCRIQGETKP